MDVMEMLRWLTDQEKARFARIQHLLESDGWRHDVQPLLRQRAEECKERGALASSWEENRIALGQRIVYEELGNLEAAILGQFLAVAEERRQAQQEADEEAYE